VSVASSLACGALAGVMKTYLVSAVVWTRVAVRGLDAEGVFDRDEIHRAALGL